MKRTVRSERRAVGARGFTLIEMLIAIAILAVIAVLSWRGLDQVIRGRTTITNAMEDERVVAQLFDQMRIDARQAATDDEAGQPAISIGGQRLADRARHVRAGHGAASAGGALPAVRTGASCASRRRRLRTSAKCAARCSAGDRPTAGARCR